MSTTDYIKDTPLIDYLRLSTFDATQFYKLTAKIERRYAGWRPAKWLQYKGRKSRDGIFHGIGDQNGRAHFIVQSTGYQSAKFARWFLSLPEKLTHTLYCTRLDLQVTKSMPEWDNRQKAYKRLRDPKSLIQSDTGTTLYIGARTSDSFWRLYDKTEVLLRVEVELKGANAKRAWAAIVRGESISGVWNRFLLRSRVPKAYTEHYRATGDLAELPDEEEMPDLAPKLNWLKTLDALVYKLAMDDDTGPETGTILRRWAEYADKFDNK